jgi:hypothetical protein
LNILLLQVAVAVVLSVAVVVLVATGLLLLGRILVVVLRLNRN